jgi:hypothetical protein
MLVTAGVGRGLEVLGGGGGGEEEEDDDDAVEAFVCFGSLDLVESFLLSCWRMSDSEDSERRKWESECTSVFLRPFMTDPGLFDRALTGRRCPGEGLKKKDRAVDVVDDVEQLLERNTTESSTIDVRDTKNYLPPHTTAISLALRLMKL